MAMNSFCVTTAPTKCVGGFKCGISNGESQCVSKQQICDGVVDCSSGADEVGCGMLDFISSVTGFGLW